MDRQSRPEAIGESEVFIEFQERLSRVAKIDRPVLIVGERGTGKELAINRLHYLSHRWQGPLIALNCAALSPSVLESELFGHEAGAFTGAMKRRQGRFEAAETGTLFLDEIGLIPIQVQEKILRVVEYREFERVGGSEPVQVDVRIIGATNAHLPELASQGKFKRDLLDRLSFEVLFLPPLRARGDDIVLLAQHFAVKMANELGLPGIPRFASKAVDALMEHPWPGNIRELKNVVERAVYACEGNEIKSLNFDPFISPYESSDLSEKPLAGEETRSSVEKEPVLDRPAAGKDLGHLKVDFGSFGSLNDAVRDLELTALRKALEATQYHQGEAAGHLGLTYHQFRGLYRKYKDDLNA